MSKAEEKLTERKVNYSLELDGKFYIVENVPARVNEETGEQYFAPETVEHLHKKIRGDELPKKPWKLRYSIIQINCIPILQIVIVWFQVTFFRNSS